MSSIISTPPPPQIPLLYEILSLTTNFQTFTSYSKSMGITNKHVMQILTTLSHNTNAAI